MTAKVKNRLVLLVVVLGFTALFFWIFKVLTKPLPGDSVADLGRDHVTDIAGITYSSNPPTSGPHFPVWAKSGVYDRLISDGYFIHSLEHGYVILWYDCTKPVSSLPFKVKEVYAHDEPVEESTDSGELLKHMKVQPTATASWISPETQPGIEVALPGAFSSESCKDLVGKLSVFTDTAQRVIVTPRVGMDTVVAVTAWGRILKLDRLDQRAITEFIKVFHNKGPERTME